VFFGANLPIIGEFANIELLTDLARVAEGAGWDGVFVWDTLLFDDKAMPPVIDPWITLASIATATSRVTFGPMVAQIARRHPWDVARQIVALDRLSNGRLVLGAGLGFAAEADFSDFGLSADRRIRAEQLDEALEIIHGLCSGQSFRFDGKHYSIKEVIFRPVPVNRRIPVWIAGYWPRRRPMRRAARWDGAFPTDTEATEDGFVIKEMSTDTIRGIRRYISNYQTSDEPFDFVISHRLPEDLGDAAVQLASFEDAGVTWILRDWLPWKSSPELVRRELEAGPLPE
jgi:alkanesulfonate monooxygenase SsuD/methylene tetrahydromethanopterin reductase-like flavin-dependent oxidoreductase (luciferase family)